MLSEQIIKQRVSELSLPFLHSAKAIVNSLKRIEISSDKIHLTLQFGFPIEKLRPEIMQLITDALNSLAEGRALFIELSWRIRAHQVQPPLKLLPQVKNVIAVASGKGGVGKSTTTVNLALALAQQGARVGILDADIYGPNQPHMLGVKEKPKPRDDKKFDPVWAHGVQSMSIGYLIDETTPMVWRGPMVSGALQQLSQDTLWDNLDYLFVDLPPGTGDIQLTLSKKVPVTGAVIVTTPQDIALLDARKGLEMFRKVNVPVLGIIENMSTHVCEKCGHEQAIFGEKGAKRMAETCDVPLLGQLPLQLAIRAAVDQGCPTVVAASDSAVAKTYQQIALAISAQLADTPINYASKFPEIVVE